ncbi:MAG TPA: hypothetical protein VFT20_00620 [Candidatus Limnocylindrales bacterium]|nr:hypothetical protein [Candidatus Limnocylindrales bacterium]
MTRELLPLAIVGTVVALGLALWWADRRFGRPLRAGRDAEAAPLRAERARRDAARKELEAATGFRIVGRRELLVQAAIQFVLGYVVGPVVPVAIGVAVLLLNGTSRGVVLLAAVVGFVAGLAVVVVATFEHMAEEAQSEPPSWLRARAWGIIGVVGPSAASLAVMAVLANVLG